MKKNLTTAVVIMLFITANYAQNVPNYVPTNGLVGWWPFNGNANDESGNGNNGTVNGATLTSDRNGNVNKAYSFDGVDDFIEIQSNSNLQLTNNYTLCGWFNADVFFNTNVSDRSIISKVQSSGWNGGYEVIIGGNTNDIAHVGNVAGNNFVLGSTGYSIGVWYMFLVTYDGNTMKLYMNGILVNSTTINGNLQTSNLPLLFGKRDGNIQYFDGKLDDIGIWNRALTQQEITALYNSCSTPPTATITPNGNTTFCQGGNVALQASGGNSYSWSNGATTQSITVTQGNTYTVTVTDGNGCTASASQVVTVNPIPSVNFSLPAFISNTVNNFSLNATPSGGTFSGTGVNGNIFNASQAGWGNKTISYSVSVNNCSNTATANTIVYDTTGLVCTTRDTIITFVSVTDTLLIDVTLSGLTPPNNTNTVKVYPNPTRDALFINNGNLASMAGYSIKITNSLGQIFFDEPVNQQQFFIDISTWATDTYLLYVINPQQAVVETKQVVLQ